jgi:hypothetical protein
MIKDKEYWNRFTYKWTCLAGLTFMVSMCLLGFLVTAFPINPIIKENESEYNRGKLDGIKMLARKLAENKVYNLPVLEITNNFQIKDCIVIQVVPVNIPSLMNFNLGDTNIVSTVIISHSQFMSDMYLNY